jgi:ornithine cyclodeaminase
VSVARFSLIRANELRREIGFADLIEPMARAFAMSSSGEAQSGFLTLYPAEDPAAGDVYVKTGVLKDAPVFIVKVAPWFKANAERGIPQGGLISFFDGATGRIRALVDDEHYLSDIRTAAAGALAARLLAPPTVRTAAVLGAGVQAYWQSRALHYVRPYRRLVIWARNHDSARKLQTLLAEHLGEVEMLVAASAREAVAEAEVIITATGSREPIVEGEWLQPGQHITAVGADDPGKCEVGADALRRARLFVDCRATAAENGDVHRAISTGQYAVTDIAGELGELVAGKIQGRTASDQITIAKLVGIGAQDVAVAQTVLERLAL